MIVATNGSFAGFKLLVLDVFEFGAGGAFVIYRNGTLCINGQDLLFWNQKLVTIVRLFSLTSFADIKGLLRTGEVGSRKAVCVKGS